jgi:hypothetical protein
LKAIAFLDAVMFVGVVVIYIFSVQMSCVCCSFDEQIVRFKDKESHQIFLEPEGRTVPELYVQVSLLSTTVISLFLIDWLQPNCFVQNFAST